MNWTTIQETGIRFIPGELVTLLLELPEVQALKAVPAGPVEHHSEGSAYEHTRMVMEIGSALSGHKLPVVLACAFHDVGKATTPAEILPKHHGHQERSVEIAKAAMDRMGVPEPIRAFVLVVAHRHHYLHDAEKLTDKAWRKLFKDLNWDEDQVDCFIDCSRADEYGRNDGVDPDHYPAGELCNRKFHELKP